MRAGLFSLRLHHWTKPDDRRYHHDHGWWFVTLVLRGGYDDITPVGDLDTETDRLRAFCVRYRPATHRHTVVPHPGGAWTLLITGPHSREWGYWVKGKLVKHKRYFRRHGLHPCDD